MIDYIKLDKLRALFKIEDDVFKYFYQLQSAMKIPPERYTILYLCPNVREAVNCYNYLFHHFQEDLYISNNKSKIIEKNKQNKRVVFYNSAKDREELIYIMPLRKLKQGFDGYRISEVRFFELNGCF